MVVKPSDSENEYFLREELAKVRRQREAAAKQTAESEKTRLKQLHWMRCPKCGMELAEVDHRGILVDACFACGGMFFDSGEVEKLESEKDPGWMGRLSSTLFGSR